MAKGDTLLALERSLRGRLSSSGLGCISHDFDLFFFSGGRCIGCNVMDDGWKVQSVPPGLLDLWKGQGGHYIWLNFLEEELCGC